jgi:pimeloyl-ACP methyl ester carboxylesterase
MIKPGRSKSNPERVAVVFVHGQGDQRPMKDVLELAHTVWETDPRAAGGDQLAPIWSVPTDEAEELPDQRRLVSDARSGVQVDFYQFYWSHLMYGNRFLHVWVWLLDLFAKKPDEVPKPLLTVRRVGMSIALLPIFLALIFCVVSIWHLYALNYLNPLQKMVETELLYEPIGPAAAPNTRFVSWETFFAGIFLLAFVGFFLPIRGYLRSRRKLALYWSLAVIGVGLIFWIGVHWHPSYSENPQSWLCDTQSEVSTICGRSEPRVPGYPQVSIEENEAGLELAALWPWLPNYNVFLSSHNVLIAVFTVILVLGIIGGLALYWLDRSFLSPVMADSARYFRPAPENIEARHAIRRAGVRLLERLHKSPRGYDRIVVVAHSLGSVVAYGMLEQFWGKRSGALACRSVDAKTVLRDAEESARALINCPTDKERLSGFREGQRRMFQSLVAEHYRRDGTSEAENSWRVSDFITLGSPLTYGPFLLADSRDEFEAQARKHRRYALCPPDGDWD